MNPLLLSHILDQRVSFKFSLKSVFLWTFSRNPVCSVFWGDEHFELQSHWCWKTSIQILDVFYCSEPWSVWSELRSHRKFDRTCCPFPVVCPVKWENHGLQKVASFTSNNLQSSLTATFIQTAGPERSCEAFRRRRLPKQTFRWNVTNSELVPVYGSDCQGFWRLEQHVVLS